AAEFMVGDEEVLDLFQQVVVQVLDRLDIPVVLAFFRNGEQPVVSLRLAAVALFGLDDTNEPTTDPATGKDGLLHEEEHIEWIAVVADRGRNEAEVKRED